jgi:PIN domain nuclease of toxin-antitoxin system
MAPTRCNAAADEWIASNASLLNFRFVAITNLREILIRKKFRKLLIRDCAVRLGQLSKSLELVVVDDDIAERAGEFGDAFPGDPVDRMIVATALVRDVPLVTYDEKLRTAEHLKTIW